MYSIKKQPKMSHGLLLAKYLSIFISYRKIFVHIISLCGEKEKKQIEFSLFCEDFVIDGSKISQVCWFLTLIRCISVKTLWIGNKILIIKNKQIYVFNKLYLWFFLCSNYCCFFKTLFSRFIFLRIIPDYLFLRRKSCILSLALLFREK